MRLISVRFAILCFCGALALVGEGFHSLGDSLSYHGPVAVTYDNFVAQDPQAGWFTVSGGYLDLTQSMLPYDPAKRAYYVPYVTAKPAAEANAATPPADISSANSEPGISSVTAQAVNDVDVLTYVTDPATVNQIDAFNNAGKRNMTTWGMEHSSELPQSPGPQLQTEMTGMVTPEINQDDATEIQRQFSVSPQVIVMAKDKSPNALLGILYLVGGVLLAIGFLWSIGIDPGRLIPNRLPTGTVKQSYKGVAGRRPILQPGPPEQSPPQYPPQITYGQGSAAPLQQQPAQPADDPSQRRAAAYIPPHLRTGAKENSPSDDSKTKSGSP